MDSSIWSLKGRSLGQQRPGVPQRPLAQGRGAGWPAAWSTEKTGLAKDFLESRTGHAGRGSRVAPCDTSWSAPWPCADALWSPSLQWPLEFISGGSGDWQRPLVPRELPFRKSGRWKLAVEEEDGGLGGPVFRANLARQAGAVSTKWACVGGERLALLSLHRRLQRCLREVMFHFWQNLVKGHESNSFGGSFWKEEIQNVLIHLL